MLYTLDRFNQLAAKQYLSAGAILLWQRLYFTMQRKNQFADLQQNTAALIAQLNITRQGLQLMRQALIEKGFLKVRVDEHQQTFYTLMLDGKVVGEGANIQTENAVGAVAHHRPSVRRYHPHQSYPPVYRRLLRPLRPCYEGRFNPVGGNAPQKRLDVNLMGLRGIIQKAH